MLRAVAAGFVALVALEHVWFLLLEMVFWTRPLGLRTFRMTPQKARDSAALAANQGLYNGFLAAGLVWSLVATPPDHAFALAVFFLTCVVIAGIFGAFTVSRRILALQAAPALAALVLAWLAHGR
jgi:putative membrane protein